MRLPVMPPVAPMLAKVGADLPPGAFYEPKWDGFRSIVFRVLLPASGAQSRRLAVSLPASVASTGSWRS